MNENKLKEFAADLISEAVKDFDTKALKNTLEIIAKASPEKFAKAICEMGFEIKPQEHHNLDAEILEGMHSMTDSAFDVLDHLDRPFDGYVYRNGYKKNGVTVHCDWSIHCE